MGNYVSCSFAHPVLKTARAARVIFPATGEIRQLRQQSKAAELMLESPSSFLVDACSLRIGRRFSALAADEDLEMGNLYVAFPMRRVNSVVTAADMAVFLMAANSAAKRISGGKVGILPPEEPLSAPEAGSDDAGTGEATASPRLSKLNLGEIEGVPMEEFQRRLAVCRSRKPLLETIREEPPLRSR